ncbi:MAG: hypothetical protein ACXU84_21720 [Xanthobacteraceae bacterium]
MTRDERRSAGGLSAQFASTRGAAAFFQGLPAPGASSPLGGWLTLAWITVVSVLMLAGMVIQPTAREARTAAA